MFDGAALRRMARDHISGPVHLEHSPLTHMEAATTATVAVGVEGATGWELEMGNGIVCGREMVSDLCSRPRH